MSVVVADVRYGAPGLQIGVWPSSNLLQVPDDGQRKHANTRKCDPSGHLLQVRLLDYKQEVDEGRRRGRWKGGVVA